MPFIDNKIFKFVKNNGESFTNLISDVLPDENIKKSINLSKEMVCFLWRIGIDAIQLYKENESKKLVFVIDDLERCDISINNIFGYFSNILNSNYIEFNDDDNTIKRSFNKNRVIFVLNEKELSNTQKETYIKTKEKIVGVEYELSPEIEVVLNDYRYDLNETIKIEVINKCIKDVCENVNFYNLRMIKYTQQYINSILKELQTIESQPINELYIKKLVTYFTVIMIQKIKGNISKETEILPSLKTYFLFNNLWDSTKRMESDGKFEIKWIPLYEILFDIVFKGNIDAQEIQNDYKKWVQINIESSDFNNLCYKYIYMDEKTFKEKYNHFQNEFDCNKMLDMNNLYKFYQLQLDLIEKNILNTNISKIDLQFKKYLRRNNEKLNFDNFRFEYEDIMFEEENYQESHNGNRLPKMMNKMIEMSLKHYDSNHYLGEFIDAYKNTNIDEIIKFINFVDPSYEEFILPILSKVDLNEYFDYLLKFSIEDQIKIFEAFSIRYKEIIKFDKEGYYSKIINAYEVDKVALIKLSKLYNSPKSCNYMNPENYMRNELSKKYYSLINLDNFNKNK